MRDGRVHDRIRGYAADDRDLLAITAKLKSEAKRFAAHLNEVSLQYAYYDSSNAMRMPTEEGKARKGGHDERRVACAGWIPSQRFNAAVVHAAVA